MSDVVVVGAGPNGLTAGAALARAGHRVQLIEGASTIGGGTRSAELTLPGVVHDVCSAFHPLAAASPAFADLDLSGVTWITPPVAVAHPLDDGSAPHLSLDLDATVDGLDADGAAYRRLIEPFVEHFDTLLDIALAPPLRAVRHPVVGARLGLLGLSPASRIARRFDGEGARALFAGLAAHSIAPLDAWATSGVALVLAAAAHVVGWPLALGGSQTIADALAENLTNNGGTITTGQWVSSLDELPVADATVLDVMPSQFAAMAGDRLSARERRPLDRYRHGPGVFKIDLAIEGPIPWTAEPCRHAGTVHVGGTWDEITHAEAEVAAGRHPERPFVLVGQQSLFDPSRTTGDLETVWAYTHVPAHSPVDATDSIVAQIERFAPGFRDRIVATSTMSPSDMERYNPSYVGGDITGGAISLRQVFARPRLALDPYRTALDGVWLASAATPPGAGSHGMCGWNAAKSVLGQLGQDE